MGDMSDYYGKDYRTYDHDLDDLDGAMSTVESYGLEHDNRQAYIEAIRVLQQAGVEAQARRYRLCATATRLDNRRHK